nr:RecName: Full=Gymnin [Gymnocladus chinensis]
KTCENLADDY